MPYDVVNCVIIITANKGGEIEKCRNMKIFEPGTIWRVAEPPRLANTSPYPKHPLALMPFS